MVTDSEGQMAVEIARAALRQSLGGGAGVDQDDVPGGRPDTPPVFREKRGVFVTLTRARSGDLRGCIGFPLPHFPMGEGLSRAAVAAALDDPRFPNVRKDELGELLVEISLLTVPRPVLAEPREGMPEMVRVGRDGLIVDGFGSSGLLLPQVAVELHWGARRFLDETCVKAGLARDAWLDARTTVRSFEAEVFHETVPGGTIVRATLEPSPRPAGPAARRT